MMKIHINGFAVFTVTNPLRPQSGSIVKKFDANISVEILPDAASIPWVAKIRILGVSTLRSKIECLYRGAGNEVRNIES